MIWREKRLLLIVLGVLLAANIVFFLTYRVQYQSRLDEMDERLAQAEGQLEKARRGKVEAEASLAAYRKVERDVQQVFDQTWSTQPRRLTLLIAEVKRLAIASNAIPKTLSFGRNEAAERIKTGRQASKSIGAHEVSIGFSVTANYDQIRRMINLLELSNQFVIIDQISLATGGENLLTLNLRVKTLFRDEQESVVGGDRL